MGITTAALGVITGGLAVLGIGVLAYKKYQQVQEEIHQSTVEATQAFQESSNAIKDYTSRYKELRQALLDAKGDEEETYNVKKQLLALQDEINEKFGDEYGRINLVTDAYRNQTSAIEEYNKKISQAYQNENIKGFEQAKKEIEQTRSYDLSSTAKVSASDYEKISGIVSKYQDKGMTIDGHAISADSYTVRIHLVANADDANKTIQTFMNDIKEEIEDYNKKPLFDSILGVSSDALNSAKETINEYKNLYVQAQVSEIQSDDTLSKGYEQAIQAVEAYNDAVASGKESEILRTRDNLNAVKSSIDLTSDEWSKYGNLMTDIFDQADTGLYDFKDAIDTNKDGMKELTESLKGSSDIDLLAIKDEPSSEFNLLITKAKEYGLEVQDVINLLIEMGIVQGKIADSTKEEKIIDFSSVTESLEKMTGVMDSFDKAYADFLDKDKEVDLSDFSAIQSALSEINGYDMSNFESFMSVLTDSASSTEDVQKAFNDLVGSYIDASGILDSLDDSAASYVTTQLEAMGVANAEEIVNNKLQKTLEQTAAQKYLNEQRSINLSNATADEVTQLVDEGTFAGIAKNALIELVAQKIISNSTALSTSGDIENLKALAIQAGITGDALANAKPIGAGINFRGANPYFEEYKTDLYDLVMEQINKNSPNVEYSGGSSTNSKGSSKNSDKSFFNQFDPILEQKKKEIEQLIQANEELNLQYETAVKRQDNELAENLYNQIIEGKTQLQKAYADSAQAIRSVLQGQVLPALFEIAPELKGLPVDKFSEEIIAGIEERLKDNSYSSGMFSSLLSTAQNMFDMVGSHSGQGDWAKDYAGVIEEIDSAAHGFYEHLFQLMDEEAKKHEYALSVIDDVIDKYDDQLSLLESFQKLYGNSQDTEEAYYKASLYKLQEYVNKEGVLHNQLTANQQNLAEAKKHLASISPADPRYADTFQYLSGQVEEYTKAIRENEDAIRNNKQAELDFYNSVVSEIENNLSDIYKLQKEKAEKVLSERQEEDLQDLQDRKDAAVKASESIVDGLNDELEALKKRNEQLGKTNKLLDIQLELQKVYRDKSFAYIDETTGKEISTYDREKAKELQQQLEDELRSQAYDKQVEDIENRIDKQEEEQKAIEDKYDKRIESLKKEQEEEQEAFDTYWDRQLSSYNLHMEAMNLAQKFGYNEALLGTQQYLNNANSLIMQENESLYKSGLSLTQNLIKGMFENLDGYLSSYTKALRDGLAGEEIIVPDFSYQYAGSDRLAKIAQMKANSGQWAVGNRQQLESENQSLGQELGAYFDRASGNWYTDSSKSNLLFDELNNNAQASEKNTSALLSHETKIQENSNALSYHSNGIGKNTYSIDQNTVTVSDGVNTVKIATEELINSNINLMDMLSSSMENIINALENASVGYSPSIHPEDKKDRNNTSDNGYAYYDKGGIMHVVKDEKTAQQYASGGIYSKYEGSYHGGYATDENGNELVVYDNGKQYSNGNAGDSDPDNILNKDVEKAMNKLNEQYRSNGKDVSQNTKSQKQNTQKIDSNTSQSAATAASIAASAASVATGMASLPAAIASSVAAGTVRGGSSSGHSGSPKSSSSSDSSGLTSGFVNGVYNAIGNAAQNTIDAIKKNKKHDGIESGFVGENHSFGDKDKIFRDIALGNLKPNEQPIVALKDEAILTQEQIGNVVDTVTLRYSPNELAAVLKGSYTPVNPLAGLKRSNLSGLLSNSGAAQQSIDNSSTYNIYGMTIKSDNITEFVRELKIKSRLG